MVKTLKLKHPVTIDGRKLDELTYDEEQITGNLICEAERRKSKRNDPTVVTLAENDNNYHIYLGYALIIAANPTIAFEELAKQITGSDVVKVGYIGRSFLLNAVGELAEGISEGQPETMQRSTTQE